MIEATSSDFIARLSQVPELDLNYALGLIDGSEAMYEKTVKYIVRFIPSNIELMDTYLNTDNALNDFAVKVHGIKSSLRQLGHLRLAKQAEKLEDAAKTGDRLFYVENYDSFRDDLLSFYNQINAVIVLFADEDAVTVDESNNSMPLNDFYDMLTQVKADVEGYDTLSATDHLLPLTKHRFGEETDQLITKTMEALETFKPRIALEYITELLSK